MRHRLLPPAVLLVLTLPVFSRIVLSGDHMDHVGFALKLIRGQAVPPHPLFHALLLFLIGGDNPTVCPGMAVLMLGAAVAFQAWLTVGILTEGREVAALSPSVLTLLCLALVLAMPLPNWWHGDPLIGQVSPNVWHNPTTVFAMPFALTLFVAGNRLLAELTFANAARVSLVAVLSLLAKPNYVLAYAPALGIALLAGLGRGVRARSVNAPVAAGIFLAVVAAPAVVLAGQYEVLTRDTRILFAPLEVWHCYSRHVAGSILIGIAFPLAVALCYPVEANSSRTLTLAWATLAVAVGTFACFAESSKRISDGNFGWGVTMADNILFVASLDFLLRQPGGIRQPFCLLILFLHALSGIAFLERY